MDTKSNRMNIAPKVFGGLVYQMMGNAGVRADLKKLGYNDELISDGVAAGAELPAEVAGGSSLQKSRPAGAPIRVGRARKKTSTELNQLNQLNQLNSTSSTPQLPQ